MKCWNCNANSLFWVLSTLTFVKSNFGFKRAVKKQLSLEAHQSVVHLRDKGHRMYHRLERIKLTVFNQDREWSGQPRCTTLQKARTSESLSWETDSSWCSAGSFNKQHTPNNSFICNTEEKTLRRWPFKKSFKDQTTSEAGKCEERGRMGKIT